jgi:hypothetical protein
VGGTLCNNGDIIDPDRIKQRRAIGPGGKTFDELDHCVLLFLYMEEPSRSNASYVENLMCITGSGAVQREYCMDVINLS